MEEKDKRQRSKEEKLMFLKAAEEHGITGVARCEKAARR